MNVNLLPKKFIKNRAMDVIIVTTALISAILIIAFLITHLFFTTQVRTYTNNVQIAQTEKIELENRINELQQAQSQAMQDFLLVLKGEQKLMEPIMSAFNDIAHKLNLTLINYEVYLAEGEAAGNQKLVGEDGTELLPTITIKFRGDLFSNSPSFKENVEMLEWVYDCQPISMSRDNDYAEAEFAVRLKMADVPVVLMKGEAADE
ncbi:hypothetical protein IW492_07860 [Enterococcus sp. BWB1-3]|uniref:hypothetical protein n=1 Tax=unclassified Enterococcus TaxID=2608891 RepID=UPI001924C64D|nr:MULTISPECIES: hypothetical protein [unclassified Enterococcus]MBL1229148.1 hypothetical protein [Enterococcus sp. BWB1-3]MCB5952528.1 hypothetical protein [Enterococcus sp. BWT-B8]MCB5953430.1 hypothetical protein [Enterococcus sp. CWB-B31]